MYESIDIQQAWAFFKEQLKQYEKDNMIWHIMYHKIALWAMDKQTTLPQKQPGLCPDCGKQNPVDQKFCGDCGRKLKIFQ